MPADTSCYEVSSATMEVMKYGNTESMIRVEGPRTNRFTRNLITQLHSEKDVIAQEEKLTTAVNTARTGPKTPTCVNNVDNAIISNEKIGSIDRASLKSGIVLLSE